MADKTTNVQQPVKGMVSDMAAFIRQDGTWRYMLNGNIEFYTDEGLPVVGNESSNHLYCIFPDGFIVIGRKVILPLRLIIYCLVNPVTNQSSIGYTHIYKTTAYKGENHILPADCEDCGGIEVVPGLPLEDVEQCPVDNYLTLANDDCLNFDKTDPVKIEYRITDCDLRIYFTDGGNYRRYMYFDILDNNELRIQPQFYAVTGYDPSCDSPIRGTALDCNAIRVQPPYDRICLTVEEVVSGGRCVEGTYQFFAAWADSTGVPRTEYMQATALVPIKSETASSSDEIMTDRGILLGLVLGRSNSSFLYVNIAVARTTKSNTRFYKVATISAASLTYFYTDNLNSYLALGEDEFYKRPGYYDTADGITSSNNILFWRSLGEMPLGNWQRMALELKLQWYTANVPITEMEKHPGLQARYQCFMRDEVYPMGCVIEFDNGAETDYLHIPNRTFTVEDTIPIHQDDKLPEGLYCNDNTYNERWRAFSTATILGRPHEQYVRCGEDAIWEYGEFGYWESFINYPDNETIWGDLRCTPIRHHKFPDCSVSPLYSGLDENNVHGFAGSVYPIGVCLNSASLTVAIQLAIAEKWITQELADRITGIRIVRGNRQGNESVRAKGLFYDVWSYHDSKRDHDIFYPNYPYNDLRPDQFLSPSFDTYDDEDSPIKDEWKMKFANSRRYTFHSPDTHFKNPPEAINELRMEIVAYGEALGRFRPIDECARYQMPSAGAVATSAAIAAAGAIAGIFDFIVAGISLPEAVKLFFDIYNFISVNLPRVRVFWQYQSSAYYNNFTHVDSGHKRRATVRGMGLEPYLQSVSETIGVGSNQSITFNNFLRESSYYVSYNGTTLKTASDYKEDDSRFTLIEKQACDNTQRVQHSHVSSYYGSIKALRPDQYGNVYSIDYLETSSCAYTYKNGGIVNSPIVFGGDTHICRFGLKRKHAFYSVIPLNLPDNADFDCRLYPNVGYPNYWMQYGGDLFKQETSSGILEDLVDFLPELVSKPLNRFECNDRMSGTFHQGGIVYAQSYGIPYFICESSVNVACRRAENFKEKDFYPRQQDLDYWLQPKNVPITDDNYYLYNKDYSKQNSLKKGRTLPVTYNPNKECITKRPNLIIYTGSTYGADNRSEYTDQWLRELAADSHEFTLEWGRLIGLHGIEGDAVLALFEHNAMIFNSFVTMNTSGDTAIVSTGQMFQSKPKEFSRTDVGYVGSQMDVMLNSEHGHVIVDPERGDIFMIGPGGQGVKSLVTGNQNLFATILPFQLLRSFPHLRLDDIDNPYIRLGIALGYDYRYSRMFITKHDYEVINPAIKFDDGIFYTSKETTGTVEKIKYSCPAGEQLVGTSCHKTIYTPALLQVLPATRTITVYIVIYNNDIEQHSSVHTVDGNYIFGCYQVGVGREDDWGPGGYEQYFADQVNPGFIGYLINGLAPIKHKVISTQVYWNGSAFIEAPDGEADLTRKYYQRFTFTNVPPGVYSFAIASHLKKITDPDFQFTSTYVAGRYSISDWSAPDFTNIIDPDKELLIDVCNGDFDGSTETSILAIHDLTRSGERSCQAVCGYIREGIDANGRSINPISHLRIDPKGIEDNENGRGSITTDRNGFYYSASLKNGFETHIYGISSCEWRELADSQSGNEGKLYKHDHIWGIVSEGEQFDQIVCNRLIITGRIIDDAGAGVPNIGIFLTNGGDGITDNNGFYSIVTHYTATADSSVTTRNEKLIIVPFCYSKSDHFSCVPEIDIVIDNCVACVNEVKYMTDIIITSDATQVGNGCYKCDEGEFTVKEGVPYCTTFTEHPATVSHHYETEVIEERTEVSLNDCNSFRNHSWTATFRLDSGFLIGFHTVKPNFYNSLPNFFQMGINSPNNFLLSSVWSHLVSNKSFQVFFGQRHPFMVDIPSKANLNTVNLQALRYKPEFWRYSRDHDRSLDELLNFNKVFIYTNNQSTGVLEPVLVDDNAYDQNYPKVNPINNSIQVSANYMNGSWVINDLYNTVKSTRNGVPVLVQNHAGWHRSINVAAVDIQRLQDTIRINSESFTVRFISDNLSKYKLLLHYVMFMTGEM